MEKSTFKIAGEIAAQLSGQTQYPHPLSLGVEEPGQQSHGTVTMTDATEMVYGTSGRGNPNFVKKILAAATLGYLYINTKGRNRRVGITALGYEAARAHQELENAAIAEQNARYERHKEQVAKLIEEGQKDGENANEQ